MKIRIGTSLIYLDLPINHPYELSNLDEAPKKIINDTIIERDISCAGCGKSLKNRGWLVILHRPKSARTEDEDNPKNIWAIFPICHETSQDCGKKWLDKRSS